MTFKEKHLVALTLGTCLLMGCSENKKAFNDEYKYDSMGLLDERPMKDCDRYNSKIVIHHVNIPVYNSEGQRIEDQYVLTRGLEKSDYKSRQKPEEMKVKAVHINGNPKVCYVKADANNAIYTERGFCGLFIDKNQNAIVIADDNIQTFVDELKGYNISQNKHKEQHKSAQEIKENNSIKNDVPVDSVKTDTIRNNTSAFDIVPTDTVSDRTFNEKQFIDTLQSIRQREI